MVAAMTHLPVLGVPVESKALKGQDSLLSIVQMPAGVPVGTLAIGEAGRPTPGCLAAAILATADPALAERLRAFRAEQTAAWPKRRATNDPARLDDRHPRRRPARPHARGGRGTARLPLPCLFAGAGQRRRRGQREVHVRRLVRPHGAVGVRAGLRGGHL
jgi:hypothetical protein